MGERNVWFLKLTDQYGTTGIGEVAPIEGLSPEDVSSIPDDLMKIKPLLLDISCPPSEQEVFNIVSELVPPNKPSLRFGLEMAMMDLMNGGDKHIFQKDLDNIRLPINGLVWMGDEAFMRSQVQKKLDEGYQCIKLKVGAIDFETELDIIRSIRKISDELIIRLDANGAFQTNEVLAKLSKLSTYSIHSIEQPIMPLQPEAMELICNRSEIPVALDEELIGVESSRERIDMLQELKPHYLVLKPTLHGGFASVKEWIDLAEMHGIKWWITSYLESNLGLNAIAQFAHKHVHDEEHQGLGTGDLYHNNLVSPIVIDRGYLTYAASHVWEHL